MFKKGKILVSLVVLTLIISVFGSLKSLATEITAGNTSGATVITPITAGKNNTANTISITGTVTNKTTNSTVNNTVNNVVNKANTSSYEKTNTSKLPYAGTNSTGIFMVIAFAASAIYAYKKVTEYNV